MGCSTMSEGVAAVTAQGHAFVASDDYPDAVPQPGSTWRTATITDWYARAQAVGIDASGRILGSDVSLVPGNRLVVSLATVSSWNYFWYVTTDGLGFFKGDTTELALTRVQAVCVGSAFACFLTTFGRVVCADFERAWGPIKPTNIFQPGGLEPLVEIACGGPKYACGLTVSGDVTCFGPEAPKPRSNSPKFKSVSTGGPGVCGITLGGEVYCWSNEWERTYGRAGSAVHVLAASYGRSFCSLDTSD